MNKFIIAVLAAAVLIIGSGCAPDAYADHRMETEQNLCHFVKPTGIANNNNGDEIKSSGCRSDIITNNDGTRTGSVVSKRKYAPGTMPMATEYHYASGGDTAIVCNMVDGNNTYQTADWTVTYEPKIEHYKEFQRAFGTAEGDRKYKRDFDFNEDNVIDYQDLSAFSAQATGKIEYVMACYNGVAQ